jgi:hypothetical protein
MEINAELAQELINRKIESSDLDYKEKFNDTTKDWLEIAKDVYGIANSGGGYIVFGVQDGTFKPIGLDENFHKDSQTWVDKFSKWSTGQLKITYFEHSCLVSEKIRKFPILYVHGSIGSLVIPKSEGAYKDEHGIDKVAFRQGTVYTRRNSATIAATGEEFWHLFWALLKRTSEERDTSEIPIDALNVLNHKMKPDCIEETLWSNLFPVKEIPDKIFSANTKYRFANDIYSKINQDFKNEVKTPAFLLEDGLIYSFAPFDELNPLSLCISSSGVEHSTQEWLDEPKLHQKLVKLLNYNLKELCKHKKFFYDADKDRYYTRYFGGPVPSVTWKPYKATSTRELVNLKINKNTGRLTYCEHFGGRIRFTLLGTGVYLIIEPIRVLTRDGSQPLDNQLNIKISTKNNVHYHNNNYLYDMKLWLHILAGNKEEVHLGQEPYKIIISILPLTSKTSFGIVEDQHTGEDFLDSLKSEPLDYFVTNEDTEDVNPLNETSLED